MELFKHNVTLFLFRRADFKSVLFYANKNTPRYKLNSHLSGGRTRRFQHRYYKRPSSDADILHRNSPSSFLESNLRHRGGGTAIRARRIAISYEYHLIDCAQIEHLFIIELFCCSNLSLTSINLIHFEKHCTLDPMYSRKQANVNCFL